MNILFDFIPFQDAGGVGGAASFTYAVLQEVCRKRRDDQKILGLYDSRFGAGRMYDHQEVAARLGAELVDIHEARLAEHIERLHIDTLFISIGQFYAAYDLTGITCRTIMFIHDIYDVERLDARVDAAVLDRPKEPLFLYLKRMTALWCGIWKRRSENVYDKILPLYTAPKTVPYTVSRYSRNALRYYFPVLKQKEINICYSPAKSSACQSEIESDALRKLIEQKSRFFLMLAANRHYKNPGVVIKVFERLVQDYPDVKLLTLNYGRSVSTNHFDIKFLSDSDLEYAYKHAYALLFPSFFEGFGYPPIEAIKYGTPCIASNVTSIPEVLGEAGIYFSPFYPADLYRAMSEVLEHRDSRKEQMARRNTEISEQQRNDLDCLCEEILKDDC